MGKREGLPGYDLKGRVVASLDRKRLGRSLSRPGSGKLRRDYPSHHGPGGYRPCSTVHLAMPNAKLGAM
jgi:hypothetical protein